MFYQIKTKRKFNFLVFAPDIQANTIFILLFLRQKIQFWKVAQKSPGRIDPLLYEMSAP